MASSGSGGPPQSKDQVHYELIKTLNSGSEEQKKAIQDKVDFICEYFPYSKDYKSGDKSKSSYKLCCETVDYCSFYHQRWFFTLCTVVASLILIIVIIVLFDCVKKRRHKDIEIGDHRQREEQMLEGMRTTGGLV